MRYENQKRHLSSPQWTAPGPPCPCAPGPTSPGAAAALHDQTVLSDSSWSGLVAVSQQAARHSGSKRSKRKNCLIALICLMQWFPSSLKYSSYRLTWVQCRWILATQLLIFKHVIKIWHVREHSDLKHIVLKAWSRFLKFNLVEFVMPTLCSLRGPLHFRLHSSELVLLLLSLFIQQI